MKKNQWVDDTLDFQFQGHFKVNVYENIEK